MDIFWNWILPILVVLLAFAVGWILRGRGRQSYGVLNVVVWPDGTADLLLQIEKAPGELQDMQEIVLQVHKTERSTRG